jgi:uncharacterized protein YdaU (DUF1376 family)
MNIVESCVESQGEVLPRALPWFKFFARDFLAETKHMSTLEIGAFMLLMAHYWVHRELPTDDRDLARVAGLDPRTWRKSRAKLLRSCAESCTAVLSCATLDKQETEAREAYAKRAEAGRKGGAKLHVVK